MFYRGLLPFIARLPVAPDSNTDTLNSRKCDQCRYTWDIILLYNILSTANSENKKRSTHSFFTYAFFNKLPPPNNEQWFDMAAYFSPTPWTFTVKQVSMAYLFR